MTIRFKCSNAACGKVLVVKDELAGKKGKCPACKQPVTIPVPTAKPADLEEFAAKALAGDGDGASARVAAPAAAPASTPAASAPAAPAAPPAAPKGAATIDFVCDFCGETVHVPASEAGKRVPCPNAECRKIIKVPALKEDKPKDWRTAQQQTGPSFAKRDEPEKPAGAWDVGPKKVSQDALEEAGVIVEEAEPVTLRQRVRFWGLAALIALVVVGAYFGITAWFSLSAQRKALNQALAYVEPKSKLSAPLTAEVHRAEGEFHVQARKAEAARLGFAKARAAFLEKVEKKKLKADKPDGKKPDTDRGKPDKGLSAAERESDRDLFLIDLAASQVGLGGTPDEVLSKERLDWDEPGRDHNQALQHRSAAKEINATLQAITSPEARALALREVAAKLFRKGQKPLAVGLGLKLSSAKGGGAKAGNFDPGSLALAQVVALLFAADQGKAAEEKLSKVKLPWVRRLSTAEARALQGDFEKAREEAQRPGDLLGRLLASLAVAAVALEQGKLEEARTSAEDALKAEAHLRKQDANAPALLLLRQYLARVAARAGVSGAEALPKTISDRACKARARLEFLYLDLEKRQKDGITAEPKLADDIVKDKETLSYARALEAIARHNARLGGEGSDNVEALEERFRPLAHVGVALGIQDKRR
jgi:hypothetical protein